MSISSQGLTGSEVSYSSNVSISSHVSTNSQVSITENAFNMFSECFTKWVNKECTYTPAELNKICASRTEAFDKVLVSQQSSSSQQQPTQFIDSKTRLVLNIMIKNESHVLERCITSMLPFIDGIVVSDTGSTDNSFEVIRDTIYKHKDNVRQFPFSIEVKPWKNFGANRTIGLHQCQRFIKHCTKWDPAHTFILLCDADMTYNKLPQFKLEDLESADEFNVEQIAGAIRYWNPRILRASCVWQVMGATHEYYTSPQQVRIVYLHSLKIIDMTDGSNRANKYERDEKLLLQDLDENPANARAMFYLAQTYLCRGDKIRNDYENSIKYYKKHIETGSFEEEMWYAMYAIGNAYALNDNWPMALHSYMEAFERRPQRAEPLIRIGKYYKEKNQHHNAMAFFSKALMIPYPSDDMLFVEALRYNYELAYDTSISAFYAGKNCKGPSYPKALTTTTTVPSDAQMLQIGHACIEKVLLTLNVPENYRSDTYHNARHYIKPYPFKTHLTKLNAKLNSPFSNYNPCNPSIIVNSSGELDIILRFVNYTQKCARNYKIRDADNVVRTENAVMHVSKSELETIFTNEGSEITPSTPLKHIQRNSTGPYFTTCQIRGLEDMRVFRWRDKVYATCTSLEHTVDNSPRQCMAEFGVVDGENCVVTVTRLRGHNDQLVQKNWLPFVMNGDLFFIYGYNPVTVLRYIPTNETNDLNLTVHCVTTAPINMNGFRGSSGPVFIDEKNILVMIHEVAYHPDEGRRYMHRFILFNDKFEYVNHSKLFYFHHAGGVEMVTGMVMVGPTLYVTMGIEDAESYLMVLPVADVLNFIGGKFSSIS